MTQADADALFDSGMKHFENREIEEAISCFIQSAKLGSVNAVSNLAVFYSSPDLYPGANSKDFLAWLIMLAFEHKDPGGMLDLGTIYCGSPRNVYISRFPELMNYYNPAEGFRLIDEGVEKDKGSEILGFQQYHEAYNAYHNETKNVHQPGSNDSFFKGDAWYAALKKKVFFAEKAVTAAEAQGAPATITHLYKQIAESAKNELEAASSDRHH